ncbi:methyltransferase [Bdellovibrio svalbardensis]|uniref:Methyltransferase n=1 Tax=Bdellovibrio svalbardensis TaxID=2972972 RepID=A0ABT6DLF0_9BACT|nr:methyltransferase domain-containing protein [Bdellovibrio svalbardensis]MDG0817703.1 methyltransferase [Bdellovibrio svalbardensis]
MIEYKAELKKILLLTEFDHLEAQINSITQFIIEKDLASFFVDSIYLKSVLRLVIDEHWLQSQKSSEIHFERFIKKFFNAELKPLLFLHSFFLSSNIEGMQTAVKAISQIEKLILNCIKSKTSEFQKTFLQISLQMMSELYELEHQLNSAENIDEGKAKLSLYRSFDVLDEIFELEYQLNEVPSILQKERLFEGAGVGVQSSYATTLLALRYLNLSKGSRFIDLGSGYGRIGLVVGLMRPDIQFTGYEFVESRVDIANKASAHLHLDQHVHFVTQDLASADFKIPAADTYYIFDSFTDASYAIIMEQLQAMSLHRRITIATKGNAKLWMNNKYWSAPQEFSDSNLCFFRSTARPSAE